jgi:hypothetical protein
MGQCVQYLGPDFPALNIKNGMYYDPLIVELAKTLDNLIKTDFVNLKCLYDGCGDTSVGIPTAVTKIIDFICELNTNNVPTGSSLFCLGNNVNPFANQITNRSCSWSTSVNNQGVGLSYNMSEMLYNLPSGTNITQTRVTAYGATPNGAAVIGETSQSVGGFTIPFSSLPATLEFKATVSTPEGAVEFVEAVSITSAQNGGPFNTQLSPREIGTFGAGRPLNQTQYNEVLASNICNLKQIVSNLQKLEISDCTHVKYAKKDFNSVIQVHRDKLCDILEDLQNIGDFEVDWTGSAPGCDVKSERITLQTALNRQQQTIITLEKDVSTLIKQVNILTQRLNNCCPEGSNTGGLISSGGSGGTGGTSGGTIIGGPCGAGGNC